MPSPAARKSLPAGVLDLQAPQYPLPLGQPSRTRPPDRAIDRAVVGGGGGGGACSPSFTDQDRRSIPTTTTLTRGRLRAAVITYLRTRLDTVLAAEMVDTYGAVTIARALTGVLRPRLEALPNSGPAYEDILAWRAAGCKGRLAGGAKYRTVWEPPAGLRSPGGVLRRRLERDAAESIRRGDQFMTRGEQFLTQSSRTGYDGRAAAAGGSRG